MPSPRTGVVLAFLTVLLAACGGSVVSPDPGTSTSSSGGSSSGASSGGSSGASSSGSTGSSGVSSSGSTSGGFCRDGDQGASVCAGGCNGGVVPEVCVRGRWTCPPVPPCPPPVCAGEPPPCFCPVNCSCGASCDPSHGWTCTSACATDAGGPLFACGDKNCNSGDLCIDVAGKNGGPQTGPYQCLPNPSLCANDYSCGCEIKALLAAGTCQPVSCDQTFGNVVVHCASL